MRTYPVYALSNGVRSNGTWELLTNEEGKVYIFATVTEAEYFPGRKEDSVVQELSEKYDDRVMFGVVKQWNFPCWRIEDEDGYQVTNRRFTIGHMAADFCVGRNYTAVKEI